MKSTYDSYLSPTPFAEKFQESEFEYELLPEFEMMLNYEVSAGTRDSKEYLRWVQTNLNRILKLSPRLSVSGLADIKTKAAIKLFQRRNKIPQTGAIDDITEAALQKAGATAPPVHVITAPPDCINKRNTTKQFWEVMKKVEAKIRSITTPPLTGRIINEIHDILGLERKVDIRQYAIFLCRKISNILVIGDTIGAEVFADQKIIFLSEDTWNLVNEFLSTGDLSAITKFFQTIAHEKRHATLENTVTVDISEIKPGLDQMAADQARYRAHEILVKAEEIAVGRTMNPTYKVPMDLQETFRKNTNITKSIVTAAKFTKLRNLIIQELRKRYLGSKGCDSALTIGVLKSMETGRWFLCSSGSIVGGVPTELVSCKNADGTDKICGIH